ncbi:hypothetical protein SAMD00024442_34_30 [Candidatus Symbiothrix dinenymphae]|nr:hypothetical protein SAMD00024442_34_30 [Candidatus Symbiothrix dinenymphae]
METKDIIRLVLKNWALFVLSFFICGVIGLIYYKTATPQLNVTATVSLRHNEALSGGIAIGGGSSSSSASSMLGVLGMRTGSENIEDEALKMGSEGFLKNVVKTLGLHTEYTKVEWFGLSKTPLYDYSPIVLGGMNEIFTDTLAAGLKFKLNLKKDKSTIKLIAQKTIGEYTVASFPTTISTPYGAFTLSQSAFYDPRQLPMKLIITVDNTDVAAQRYQKKVEVDFKKKTSDFIILDMVSANVPFAKKIMNAIIDNYNQEWDADKALIADKTTVFIDHRLALVSEQLTAADNEIQQFKDKNSLTDIESDVKYYFTVSGEMQARLIEAKTQLEMANILLNFVKEPANKYALIPFNMNTTDMSINNGIAQYNGTLKRRNELHNSNMQSGLTQGIDEQLEVQRQNLLQSINNMKDGVSLSLSNLRKKESEINAKIGNIPTVEKAYIHLKREQEVQETVYVFLLEMREKMGVQNTTLLPKLKVIDAPYAKIKWASPSLKKIAVLIFFFGLVLPFAWLYVQGLRRKEGGWI